MLDLLPPLPDPSMLPALAPWAAGGAALQLATSTWTWLAKPGAFGEVVREPQLHIPGAPVVKDPYPPPWSPEALRRAAVAALLGALIGWGWFGADGTRERVQFLIEALALAGAVWAIVRLLRGSPATVGEAPHDEPANSPADRWLGALGHLAYAALIVAIAWAAIR